jgi:outer membrane protein OmpA-like peptidoglycan-associated protein
MRLIVGTSLVALAVTSWPSTAARAQEESYLRQREPAPSDAFELKAASGYTQGFGSLAPGRDVNKVAGAGLGVGAELDYRMTREWSLGVEGQYQGYTGVNNSSAWGFNANIGPTYHMAPVYRGDPWVRLGTGYRGVWEKGAAGVPGADISRHGFELVTAKLGYDVRVSQDVAIAPVLGADLTMFVWETASGAATKSMSTAQVATFIYAGLQGRFDFGGTRSDGTVPPPPIEVAVVAPPLPVAPPPPPAAPPPVEETQQVSPSIAVSEDVKNQCALELNQTPKFEFDKADLKAQDEEVLKKIAECFTTGPMKEARLRLVGRADPRGSIEYNDSLGERRAENVGKFLKEGGVDATRIKSESRGKRDARGTDEDTWSKDRRVDIMEGH